MHRVLRWLSWPFRFLPLSWSIFLALTLVLWPALIWQYLRTKEAYRGFEHREREFQTTLVSRLVSEADLAVAQLETSLLHLVRSVQATLEIAGFDAGYRYLANQQWLEHTMDRSPDVMAMTIQDALGRSFHREQPGLSLSAEARDRLAYAIAETRSLGVYRSSIFREGPEQEPYFFMGESLADSGGQRSGVMVMTVGLSPLVARLMSDVPAGYRLFICDDRGQLVAQRSKLMDTTPLMTDLPNHPLVKTYLDSGGRMAFSHAYAFNGSTPFLGGLSGSDLLPWAIVLETPTVLAFASILNIQSIHRRTAITVFFLSLGVVFLLLRSIQLPLRELLDATIRLERGDFTRAIRLEANNEFQRLALRFNVMQQAIHDYLNQMKAANAAEKRTLKQAILALVNAIDAKDPYTKGHSKRVSLFARAVAEEMGQEGDLLEETEMSALLHDIGKIGIEDAILKKPAPLTEKEYEVMKRHPEKGVAILEAMDRLAPYVDGMLYHHENYDGKGYPKGLRAKDIPLQARIVAVADAFDAMTTNRPYSIAMSHESAINRLNEMAGIRFDPEVVAAMTQAFYSGKLQRQGNRRSS
jgi:HD-GYP domain-containing protein (c-di-GMP phosphodiesterase class II)